MSPPSRRYDLPPRERLEAQAARLLLLRASAHAESERRRAAGELLARANESGRTLPRDDR
jgi:hypothetical protein